MKNQLEWVYLRPSPYASDIAEAEFIRYRGGAHSGTGKRNARRYNLSDVNYNRIVNAGGAVNLETGERLEVCITPAARVKETRQRVQRMMTLKRIAVTG